MNHANKELLRKMLNDPLRFSETDFDALMNSYKGENEKYAIQEALADFRECIRHIYDLNEKGLQETSNANTGPLGKLNKRSTAKRKETYFKRVENQKPGEKYVRIYAEGDSWFLFPTFVKDIIDWLEEEKNYLIYSDAYGGDWFTNIMYEGQYVEALSVHSPDVFLISGGGNDLVGNERMALMLSRKEQEKKHTAQTLQHVANEEQRELILLAQPYITKEFYAFIWTMKAQYTMLFNGIYLNTDKFNEMISITHGYAYPFPKKGNNYSLKYPIQPIVNSFIGTGKWLFRPLMIKGIQDAKLQRAILMTFIFEYNEMMIGIAKQFKNVYHLDFRDLALNQADWYDELHLKSHKYKEAAKRYRDLIQSKLN